MSEPPKTPAERGLPKPETCPVCGTENVYADILAMGPGISAMDYTCGCIIKSTQGEGTKYIRYDGETTVW